PTVRGRPRTPCVRGSRGAARRSTSPSRKVPRASGIACESAPSRATTRRAPPRPRSPSSDRSRRMSRHAEPSRAPDAPARAAGAPPRLARVLITADELRARVAEIGQAIARDYEKDNPVLVGVLKGALVFMADLIRVTPIELTTDFMVLSS